MKEILGFRKPSTLKEVLKSSDLKSTPQPTALRRCLALGTLQVCGLQEDLGSEVPSPGDSSGMWASMNFWAQRSLALRILQYVGFQENWDPEVPTPSPRGLFGMVLIATIAIIAIVATLAIIAIIAPHTLRHGLAVAPSLREMGGAPRKRRAFNPQTKNPQTKNR